jgi:hypothetical protein
MMAVALIIGWLWPISSEGLLSQFTVSPLRCCHHFTVSLLCWHNLTCIIRYNVSCSGGRCNFTFVQLHTAFQRSRSVFFRHLSAGGSSSGLLRLGLTLCSGGLAGWAQTLCSMAVSSDAYAQAEQAGSGSDRVSAVPLTVIPGVMVPSQQQIEGT